MGSSVWICLCIVSLRFGGSTLNYFLISLFVTSPTSFAHLNLLLLRFLLLNGQIVYHFTAHFHQNLFCMKFSLIVLSSKRIRYDQIFSLSKSKNFNLSALAQQQNMNSHDRIKKMRNFLLLIFVNNNNKIYNMLHEVIVCFSSLSVLLFIHCICS